MEKDQKPVLQGAIDLHAHYVTNTHRHACGKAGENPLDGIPALPDWSPETAFTLMDRAGIATAMLSISSPGIHVGDDAAARTLARQVNEEGANLVTAARGRFGLFASLPLPDVTGAGEEMTYAFDVLHADGLALLSNYHGTYLGHVDFEPVMAQLDTRQAVATIHPTSPPCWEAVSFGRPRPILEFPLDATRAVTYPYLSANAISCLLRDHPPQQ